MPYEDSRAKSFCCGMTSNDLSDVINQNWQSDSAAPGDNRPTSGYSPNRRQVALQFQVAGMP